MGSGLTPSIPLFEKPAVKKQPTKISGREPIFSRPDIFVYFVRGWRKYL